MELWAIWFQILFMTAQIQNQNYTYPFHDYTYPFHDYTYPFHDYTYPLQIYTYPFQNCIGYVESSISF